MYADSESTVTTVVVEEDSVKEMTLDEWRAAEQHKRMKSNFNIRKAGEGVDSSQWKAGVVYTKKKNENDEEEGESDEEEEVCGSTIP